LRREIKQLLFLFPLTAGTPSQVLSLEIPNTFLLPPPDLFLFSTCSSSILRNPSPFRFLEQEPFV